MGSESLGFEQIASEYGLSQDAIKCLTNEAWCINNLYRIVDKSGNDIPFRLNWMQQELYECKHRKKLVLKCRQLGSTTFWCIYLLNKCLFRPHQRVGIIADRIESSQNIFNKIIKHAYKNLKPELLALPQMQLEADSAREMVFANGSSIRVDTSMRSGTLSSLLVTELGKICARSPAKAEEIISGSLNTLGPKAELIIESTAEGAAGFYYDLCMRYIDFKEELSDEDYSFFFFPWWRQKEYSLTTSRIQISQKFEDYFYGVEKRYKIKLTKEQKCWYISKSAEQQELMRQEFPSYPEEAFQARFEGFFYQSLINEIEADGHVCSVPYDPRAQVHTAWDLGYRDSTSIWCFQVIGKSIHIINFYRNSNQSLQHYLDWLKVQRYNYGEHFVPHDAAAKEKGSGMSYEEQAREFGFYLRVLPRESVLLGINMARNILPMCWFEATKCGEGLRDLKAYRKAWSERIGGYTDAPVHDNASHSADAFRYLAIAVMKLRGGDDSLTAEELRRVAMVNRPIV